jgi:hypothetical protein
MDDHRQNSETNLTPRGSSTHQDLSTKGKKNTPSPASKKLVHFKETA